MSNSSESSVVQVLPFRDLDASEGFRPSETDALKLFFKRRKYARTSTRNSYETDVLFFHFNLPMVTSVNDLYHVIKNLPNKIDNYIFCHGEELRNLSPVNESYNSVMLQQQKIVFPLVGDRDIIRIFIKIFRIHNCFVCELESLDKDILREEDKRSLVLYTCYLVHIRDQMHMLQQCMEQMKLSKYSMGIVDWFPCDFNVDKVSLKAKAALQENTIFSSKMVLPAIDCSAASNLEDLTAADLKYLAKKGYDITDEVKQLVKERQEQEMQRQQPSSSPKCPPPIPFELDEKGKIIHQLNVPCKSSPETDFQNTMFTLQREADQVKATICEMQLEKVHSTPEIKGAINFLNDYRKDIIEGVIHGGERKRQEQAAFNLFCTREWVELLINYFYKCVDTKFNAVPVQQTLFYFNNRFIDFLVDPCGDTLEDEIDKCKNLVPAIMYCNIQTLRLSRIPPVALTGNLLDEPDVNVRFRYFMSTLYGNQDAETNEYFTEIVQFVTLVRRLQTMPEVRAVVQDLVHPSILDPGVTLGEVNLNQELHFWESKHKYGEGYLQEEQRLVQQMNFFVPQKKRQSQFQSEKETGLIRQLALNAQIVVPHKKMRIMLDCLVNLFFFQFITDICTRGFPNVLSYAEEFRLAAEQLHIVITGTGTNKKIERTVTSASFYYAHDPTFYEKESNTTGNRNAAVFDMLRMYASRWYDLRFSRVYDVANVADARTLTDIANLTYHNFTHSRTESFPSWNNPFVLSIMKNIFLMENLNDPTYSPDLIYMSDIFCTKNVNDVAKTLFKNSRPYLAKAKSMQKMNQLFTKFAAVCYTLEPSPMNLSQRHDSKLLALTAKDGFEHERLFFLPTMATHYNLQSLQFDLFFHFDIVGFASHARIGFKNNNIFLNPMQLARIANLNDPNIGNYRDNFKIKLKDISRTKHQILEILASAHEQSKSLSIRTPLSDVTETANELHTLMQSVVAKFNNLQTANCAILKRVDKKYKPQKIIVEASVIKTFVKNLIRPLDITAERNNFIANVLHFQNVTLDSIFKIGKDDVDKQITSLITLLFGDNFVSVFQGVYTNQNAERPGGAAQNGPRDASRDTEHPITKYLAAIHFTIKALLPLITAVYENVTGPERNRFPLLTSTKNLHTFQIYNREAIVNVRATNSYAPSGRSPMPDNHIQVLNKTPLLVDPSLRHSSHILYNFEAIKAFLIAACSKMHQSRLDLKHFVIYSKQIRMIANAGPTHQMSRLQFVPKKIPNVGPDTYTPLINALFSHIKQTDPNAVLIPDVVATMDIALPTHIALDMIQHYKNTISDL